MISQLIAANRSYRRFDESCAIPFERLRDWINLARLSASAGNGQRLKFVPICGYELCAAVFPTLAWAGYLTDWPGPSPGERPSAYIILLRDKSISGSAFVQIDEGLAAQSILLGAVEAGFGGCLIASVQQPELALRLGLDIDWFDIELVIALGKPIEDVVIEPLSDGNVKYWRDENGTHHVPKRSLEELIILPDPDSRLY